MQTRRAGQAICNLTAANLWQSVVIDACVVDLRAEGRAVSVGPVPVARARPVCRVAVVAYGPGVVGPAAARRTEGGAVAPTISGGRHDSHRRHGLRRSSGIGGRRREHDPVTNSQCSRGAHHGLTDIHDRLFSSWIMGCGSRLLMARPSRRRKPTVARFTDAGFGMLGRRAGSTVPCRRGANPEEVLNRSVGP